MIFHLLKFFPCMRALTQKIFMTRKFEMEVAREKILLEKTWLVLVQFFGNSTFPTLRQKLLFSLSCFSALFLLFWNLLWTFITFLRVFIQWELNWSSEWFVTFALSVLWGWSYLTYKSLKFQFSIHTSLIILENFKGF